MTAYRAGQWMPMTPPHGRVPVGKPRPPAKRKDRDTKPKRRKRTLRDAVKRAQRPDPEEYEPHA